MENIIKGLHYLKDVPQNSIAEMERIALPLWQNFYLVFKIEGITVDEVTMKVTQERAAPDYPGIHLYTKNELTKIVKTEFGNFFPGRIISVRPYEFIPNPVMDVNSKWIEEKMLETGTRLKDIVAETGLNKTYLSTLINGVDPLSDMAKAMFYFYFLSKKDKEGNVRKNQKKDES
jgi:hypothetical protein